MYFGHFISSHVSFVEQAPELHTDAWDTVDDILKYDIGIWLLGKGLPYVMQDTGSNP